MTTEHLQVQFPRDWDEASANVALEVKMMKINQMINIKLVTTESESKRCNEQAPLTLKCSEWSLEEAESKMIRNTMKTVCKNLIFFFLVYQYASGTRWSQVSQPLFPSDLSQTSHKGSSRDLWQKHRASIGLCHWKEEKLTAIHSSVSLLNGHIPGKEYLVDLASDVLPILLC